MNINLSEFAKNPYSGTLFNNGSGFNNPIVIITIIVVIVVYGLLFGSLGSESTTTSESAKSSIRVMEIILWSVFILLILFNGFNYIFNMDIATSIKNFFSSEPTIDIVVKDTQPKPVVPEITLQKQVFNIPDNNYTYDDAKAVCKAYGADLASWKNIKNAFEKGADWCNYGWSKDQMILFPTQYNKWLKLQKIKGHENDCGRPGINGGYISNPNAKFGVNCYGYKPKMTPNDRLNMLNSTIYPVTKKDIELDNKVKYWKNKLMDLIVSPFNNNLWSIV